MLFEKIVFLIGATRKTSKKLNLHSRQISNITLIHETAFIFWMVIKLILHHLAGLQFFIDFTYSLPYVYSY